MVAVVDMRAVAVVDMRAAAAADSAAVRQAAASGAVHLAASGAAAAADSVADTEAAIAADMATVAATAMAVTAAAIMASDSDSATRITAAITAIRIIHTPTHIQATIPTIMRIPIMTTGTITTTRLRSNSSNTTVRSNSSSSTLRSNSSSTTVRNNSSNSGLSSPSTVKGRLRNKMRLNSTTMAHRLRRPHRPTGAMVPMASGIASAIPIRSSAPQSTRYYHCST